MTRIRDVLTTRGRAFGAAGATLVICGLALGFADLTRIGVLLSGLPILAAAMARRQLPEMSVTRTVRPARLVVDQSARVDILFENASYKASPLQLAEERVDYVLGERPRFVLPRMQPGERREVSYQIRSHVRGRHRLGPLVMRVRDPFGLATVCAPVPGSAEVLVLPRVERLGGGRPRGDGVGAEGEIPHMVALHGEDDVAIRGYRDGDDLRRIHWPATAHRGELMVRQEDRPARRRAVLVLDSRSTGHRGSGASGSFEWAVSALASVAVHLSGQGYAVHLVSAETAADGHAADTVDTESALAALAVAEVSSPPVFEEVLHAAHPLTSAGGLVIAVVTDRDEELLRRTAALRQPGGTGLLLMIESGSFAGPELAVSGGEAQALANLAAAAGWSTCRVRSGTRVDEAWSAVTQGAGGMVGAGR